MQPCYGTGWMLAIALTACGCGGSQTTRAPQAKDVRSVTLQIDGFMKSKSGAT